MQLDAACARADQRADMLLVKMHMHHVPIIKLPLHGCMAEGTWHCSVFRRSSPFRLRMGKRSASTPVTLLGQLSVW